MTRKGKTPLHDESQFDPMQAYPHRGDIEDIRGTLKHRYPFLLVDRVWKLAPGRSVICRKCVTANEPYMVGHFPEQMVMPGLLVVEAMCQAAIFIARSKVDDFENFKDQIFVLASVDKLKCRRKVVPGDVLDVGVALQQVGMGGATMSFRGEARVDGLLCADASFTLTGGRARR